MSSSIKDVATKIMQDQLKLDSNVIQSAMTMFKNIKADNESAQQKLEEEALATVSISHLSMKPRQKQIDDMFFEGANAYDQEEGQANESPGGQQRDTSKSKFKLIPTQDEGELRGVPEMTFDKKNQDEELSEHKIDRMQDDLLASGQSVDFSIE